MKDTFGGGVFKRTILAREVKWRIRICSENDVPERPGPEAFHLSDGSVVSELNLKDADEETQIAAMRSWFYENFQNPAEETPYDSGEGGYIYLHGGPFDAKEELESRFDGIVPEEVIEKLADELGDESWEWEGCPRPGDYDDDYLIETIAPPSEHINRFTASIANTRKLVQTKVEASEEQFFRRMLFASVITALETYLSDHFVSSITNNPKALRKFVETFPRFQKEAIKLSDIFKRTDRLEHQVKSMLLTEVVWHRLISVGRMFTDTFGVDFREPQDQAELLRAIEVRHDLIHRSGKNKEGVEHVITPENIEKVIVEATVLASWIDSQHDKFAVDEKESKTETVKKEKQDGDEKSNEIVF